MNRKLFGRCALGSFIIGATLSGPASAAYTWDTPHSHQDTFGSKSLFYSKYRWEGRTLTQEDADTEARAWAKQYFGIQVGLFGRVEAPVDVSLWAVGSKDPSGTYSENGGATVSVLDKEIYDKQADSSQSWSKDISKTLFSKSGKFELAGFIPITVEGEAKMGMHGGLSTGAYSNWYLRRANSHYGTAGASMEVGGDIDAVLDAEAGWSGVAAVGVTATFRLLDVDVTPTAQARHVFPIDSERYVYIRQRNELPIHVRSMSGKVEIRAEYVGQTYKDELFRWDAPVDRTWSQVDETWSFYL